jgi:suppressor for copper-sensitivity B
MAYKEDLQSKLKLESVWQKFDMNKIAQYVAEGKIVVVDITADWCITCKFNKFIVWDSAHTVSLINKKNIIAMRGDSTNYDQNIYSYLASNQIYGMPFNKIYGPKAPQGIILPILLSYEDLRQAISRVSP